MPTMAARGRRRPPPRRQILSAGGGIRTRTGSPPMVFETIAYTVRLLRLSPKHSRVNTSGRRRCPGRPRRVVWPQRYLWPMTSSNVRPNGPGHLYRSSGCLPTREHVAGIPVALHPGQERPDDIVDVTVAIGVDESPNKVLGMCLHQGLLPVLQHDQPLVLEARTVLRKETWPMLPVGVDCHAPLLLGEPDRVTPPNGTPPATRSRTSLPRLRSSCTSTSFMGAWNRWGSSSPVASCGFDAELRTLLTGAVRLRKGCDHQSIPWNCGVSSSLPTLPFLRSTSTNRT